MFATSLEHTSFNSASNNCTTLGAFVCTRRQQLAFWCAAYHDKSVHSCSAGRCTMLFACVCVSPHVAMTTQCSWRRGPPPNDYHAPRQCNSLGRAAVSITRQTFRQSARSARLCNFANARSGNDYPTVRGARRVQHMVACCCPRPRDTNLRKRGATHMRTSAPRTLIQCACSPPQWRGLKTRAACKKIKISCTNRYPNLEPIYVTKSVTKNGSKFRRYWESIHWREE